MDKFHFSWKSRHTKKCLYSGVWLRDQLALRKVTELLAYFVLNTLQKGQIAEMQCHGLVYVTKKKTDRKFD